jgi:hypothetical protein
MHQLREARRHGGDREVLDVDVLKMLLRSDGYGRAGATRSSVDGTLLRDAHSRRIARSIGPVQMHAKRCMKLRA